MASLFWSVIMHLGSVYLWVGYRLYWAGKDGLRRGKEARR